MARYNSRRTRSASSKKRTNSRGKSRASTKKTTSSASKLLTLARQMGQVERGLQNSESRISEAYKRGIEKPERRQKKSLF